VVTVADRQFRGYGVDVSQTGISVIVPGQVLPGAYVRLRIAMPSSAELGKIDRWIDADGIVTRSESHAADALLGIEFSVIGGPAVQAIHGFVSEYGATLNQPPPSDPADDSLEGAVTGEYAASSDSPHLTEADLLEPARAPLSRRSTQVRTAVQDQRPSNDPGAIAPRGISGRPLSTRELDPELATAYYHAVVRVDESRREQANNKTNKKKNDPGRGGSSGSSG
jgi:hypothetical protein